MCTGFWWGNLRERDNLEDPGVGRGIILRRIFTKWKGGVKDWIDLAQDRDGWRALAVVYPGNLFGWGGFNKFS